MIYNPFVPTKGNCNTFVSKSLSHRFRTGLSNLCNLPTYLQSTYLQSTYLGNYCNISKARFQYNLYSIIELS